MILGKDLRSKRFWKLLGLKRLIILEKKIRDFPNKLTPIILYLISKKKYSMDRTINN
jgi:hypothetical protein